MRRTLFCLAVIVVFSIGSVPFSLQAHTTGFSHEETIGNYHVDIGYDPEIPRAQDRLLLDLGLLDTAGMAVPFTHVWVRIEQDGKTVLATGVGRATYGPTTLFMMTPATVAPLTVHVRFELEGEKLVETSFELPMQAGKDSAAVPGWALGAPLGLFIGAIGMFIALRRQKTG